VLDDFDADGPAQHDTLFGLPPTDALVRVLPVPFDATTSSGQGTAECFPHVLEASWQVDLFDLETDQAFRRGIAAAPPLLPELNAAARRDAALARAGDHEARARVDAASAQRTAAVETWTVQQLDRGRIPGILGGDHSVPLGAMRAAIERFPGLSILHVDAHADLRVAYEGFAESHASILHNVLDGHHVRVVQVGVRDLGSAEARRIEDDPRLHTWTDTALARAQLGGLSWLDLCAQMLAPLGEPVWVTFDIDGLDPSLCPNTGTPVPGGLSWREAQLLLAELARGHRIVGFDLCEVGAAPWDANVGARLLYKLACQAIASQGPAGAKLRSSG